jgi:hypothetical protein
MVEILRIANKNMEKERFVPEEAIKKEGNMVEKSGRLDRDEAHEEANLVRAQIELRKENESLLASHNQEKTLKAQLESGRFLPEDYDQALAYLEYMKENKDEESGFDKSIKFMVKAQQKFGNGVLIIANMLTPNPTGRAGREEAIKHARAESKKIDWDFGTLEQQLKMLKERAEKTAKTE